MSANTFSGGNAIPGCRRIGSRKAARRYWQCSMRSSHERSLVRLTC
ncbi:hypothetical protein VO64_3897 [Pseudomonas synxantha]|uniref:Threonine synthase n=1 Tax=Pseudomonas synxantha TaxID=47883 RepID=A0AAU8U1Q0_9PSED|nr:hypothetical protein VO64_3897 [Pseudomonas synxantha]